MSGESRLARSSNTSADSIPQPDLGRSWVIRGHDSELPGWSSGVTTAPVLACGYRPGNLEAHEARLAGAQPAAQEGPGAQVAVHARRPAERPGAAGGAGLPVVRPRGRVRRRRSGRHAVRALSRPAAAGEIQECRPPASSVSFVPRARAASGQLDGCAPGCGRGAGRAGAPDVAAAGQLHHMICRASAACRPDADRWVRTPDRCHERGNGPSWSSAPKAIRNSADT